MGRTQRTSLHCSDYPTINHWTQALGGRVALEPDTNYCSKKNFNFGGFYLFRMIAATFATISLMFCTNDAHAQASHRSEIPASVLNHAPDVIGPLIFRPRDTVKTDWQALITKGSPLTFSTRLLALMYAFHASRDPHIRSDVAEGLDILLNRWPSVTREGKLFRWNYNQTYESHAPGWWSGMDGFLMPVVFLAAFETFEDAKYVDLARKSLESALLSPTEGGSMWHSADGCWISEYSWQGMNESDEFYVLNGHLYGLEALKLAAIAFKDERYEEAFQCGLKGTMARADRFVTPDWSLYMLNKPTIDPPHYVIFETSQYRALSQLTGISFFSDEMIRRQRVLNKHYAPFITEDGTIILSRIGAPHPYQIDIYRNRLTCTLENGSEWSATSVSDEAPIKRGFITEKPPAQPRHCSLAALTGVGIDVVLYENSSVQPAAGHPQAIETSIDTDYDASDKSGRTVTVSPSKSDPANPDNYRSNSAKISLVGDFPITNSGLFGIELGSERRSSIGVTLVDEKGNESFRYYPALRAEQKTLVLLSKIGFPGHEKLHNKIKRIDVWLYTDTGNMTDQSDFKIDVGNVVTFANPLQLRKHMAASNFQLEIEP
ncbi:hypothetical protein Nham_1428 [Nitrobacter hamburgensis X14]|uniref:D-glucuronyl C5-epimerase C-terminal domain-containing protein n=1 Tax=Nitrobacter hamburgensis (strain DSM 10229 / NCIMB 13809 / X14) TaxID=323097 RepID=Q1QNE7_NITHX|nr:D-glucuronyl C5-epimerase family protein [Nitrobacter hamburgensis]ABE62250.1 hypothetical protein Nham_1428 [Nitrobacter hamburgensis X14]